MEILGSLKRTSKMFVAFSKSERLKTVLEFSMDF